MPLFPNLRSKSARESRFTTAVERVAGPAGFEPEQKVIFTNYAAKTWQSNAGAFGESEWPVERAVMQAYSRVVWVAKAINTIAGNSAALPIQHVDGEEVVDNSPVAHLLNDGMANPLEHGHDMRKRLSAQLLLAPRGVFVEVVRSNAGKPLRYDILPPHRTRIVPVEDGPDLVSHVEVQRPRGGFYRLAWEDVRWFRDPHPLDPFRGTTPLEAAGMSIELDFFARLFNVSFMRNDGRPGGILAVRGTGNTGDVSTDTLDRLEARFGKGPMEAGKIHAVTGEITYTDFGHTPRDMQYAETADKAKNEILAAFGTPESVLGYAAERTYDNAGQEEVNYWTITMPSHNRIVTSGFAEDVDTASGHRLRHDTSSVRVLQQVESTRREEWRTEVEKGLRSPYSYAEAAGIEDIESTPMTRALYVPTGKTPIPSREEDAAALGIAPPSDQSAPGGPPAGPSGGQDTPPVEGQAIADNRAIASAPATPAEAAAALNSGGPAGVATPAGAAAAVQQKAAPRGRSPRPRRRLRTVPDDDEEAVRVSDHPEDTSARLEADLADALDPIIDRVIDRALARLDGPKTRKHTRHWVPEYDVDTRVGTKALDAARTVDEQQVRDDSTHVAGPLLAAAAAVAAGLVVKDLVAGVSRPPARVLTVAAATAAEITEWVGTVMVDIAVGVVAVINDADQSGDDLSTIRGRVEDARGVLRGKVGRFAGDASHSLVSAARDTAARVVAAGGDGIDPTPPPGGPPVDQYEVRRTWVSRHDTRVRHTHTIADGQEVSTEVPFLVGGTLLRFPRDPTGPLRETANCRCRVQYARRRVTVARAG